MKGLAEAQFVLADFVQNSIPALFAGIIDTLTLLPRLLLGLFVF